MNHRERVQAVLKHQKPDIPVVDLGGRVASLHWRAYLDLKTYLGFGDKLEGEEITSLNTISNIDERILSLFNVPFRRLYLKPASSFHKDVAADGSFRDEWGVLYRPVGLYNERTGFPLADAALADLNSFSWPDPSDSGRVQDLAEQAQKLSCETDVSLVAGHLSAGIFQDCWNLRGIEQFMVDLVADPNFAHALLDKVTQIHIGMWQNFLDVVGGHVDVVETADDLGTQNSLLISPRLYRKMIKPYHAALNAAIREKTGAKIFFHSCGAVMPLIEDLIETGVDILNPIQPLSGLMEPDELQKRFGDRLIFHGGLDVQNLLPEGDLEQVKRHVRKYYESLGWERYIMAPTNTILPGTPPENIVAAFKEAKLSGLV